MAPIGRIEPKMSILLSLHRILVSLYVVLCPVPPGNHYLYAKFGVPAPSSTWRERVKQIGFFLVLGLPLLAVVPVIASALPSTGRIVSTAYLAAVLWLLASIDVAGKRRAVEDLRAFESERL